MLQALTRSLTQSLARRHPFADRQSKLGLTGVAFCTSVWASSVWSSQKTVAAEPALRHKLTGGAHVHLSY